VAIKFDQNRVELLGVEIIFTGEDDPRGSVWIPFDETLSIIYGKNGAGKSTILKAISYFVRGISLEDEGILLHGYARLIDPASSCSLMDQAIRNMPNTGFLNEWEGLERSEIDQKFSEMAAGLELPFPHWESSLFSAVPESVNDLEMNWSKFISHYLFLGLWERDIRYDFGALKTFVDHIINERIFCLRPGGSNEVAEWELSLAARVENNEVRDAYEDLLASPENYIFGDETDSLIGHILLDANILANRSKMPRTNSPFLATSNIAGQTISNIAIQVVDLNDDIDLNEWTKARITELVHSNWAVITDPWFTDYPTQFSPTKAFTPQQINDDLEESDNEEGEQEGLVWSATFSSHKVPSGRTLEFDYQGERQEILQRTLTFIARELPKELGITDLRISLEGDLGLWIDGVPGIFEAFDQRSESWIAVSSTSSGTQKIIGMALKIHSEIRSSNKTSIALGDEIDQGMHSLAINDLYKMLAELVPTAFITSHSPVALSTRVGERLHVHRGVQGEILVKSLDNSDFLGISVNNLGVKPYELIGTVDLVIAVEGQHDILVLEHFIKADNRLNRSNIKLISMTGVNNATNLVDSEFLLLYTDLQILAIADNTSKTDLISARDDAIVKIQKGQSPEIISSTLRARSKAIRNQHWHEQRCMLDLLALATERNLLNRLWLSGHTYADIEASLNHELFGLDKDWLELEAEYKRKRQAGECDGKSFKEYLRSAYKVSIDLKSIKTALDMTSGTPVGIQLVLDDIVSLLNEPSWSTSSL
jgi:hypothetical protein